MSEASQGGVEFPLPERSRASLAWHYTGPIGARSIAESAELWATSPRSLEDPREVHHGARVVKEVWATMRDRPDLLARELVDQLLAEDLVSSVQSSTYVLSACPSPSNVHLWSYFAGSEGVAIGLDLNYFWSSKLGLIEMQQQTETDPQKPVLAGWWDVIYSRQAQVKAAQRTLEMVASDPWDLRRVHTMHDPWRGTPRFHARVVLSTLMLLMKNSKFRPEAEIRFIFGRTSDQVETAASTAKGMRYYLPAAATPFIQIADQRSGLPIFGIACGPDMDEVEVTQTWRRLGLPADHVWRMSPDYTPDRPISRDTAQGEPRR